MWRYQLFFTFYCINCLSIETSSPGVPPQGSKDLKQIIKELEESDYGGYGSWGNFKIRREYRERNRLNKPLDDRGYQLAQLDHPDQALVRHTGSAVDYYRPQTSKELALLLEKANILKSPEKKFSLSKVPTMASVIKLGVVCMVVSTTAYLAVSPRTMPIEEYNQAYKTNLFRVGSTFAWPLLLITGVFRHTDADVNQVVHTFFMGFAIYFPLLCLVEKTAATAVRLAILK